MDEPDQPRTLAEFPYVTVRVACRHCPARRGRYRLARLVDRFGSDAVLANVLYELSRSCRWQVRPGTKRRKYVPYCRAFFLDLSDGSPPDEPPPGPAEPLVPGKRGLRVIGGRQG